MRVHFYELLQVAAEELRKLCQAHPRAELLEAALTHVEAAIEVVSIDEDEDDPRESALTDGERNPSLGRTP